MLTLDDLEADARKEWKRYVYGGDPQALRRFHDLEAVVSQQYKLMAERDDDSGYLVGPFAINT